MSKYINLVKSMMQINTESAIDKALIMAKTCYTKDMITPNLYVGGCYCTNNLQLIAEEGITYIINLNSDHLGQEVIYNTDPMITRLNINARDTEDYNIAQHFQLIYDFIENAFNSSRNVKILVQCSCGISRSSAVVIYYLMRSRGIDYDRAYDIVKSRRLQANPNSGFVKILKETRFV